MLPGLVPAVQGTPASQRNCSMKYAFTGVRSASMFRATKNSTGGLFDDAFVAPFGRSVDRRRSAGFRRSLRPERWLDHAARLDKKGRLDRGRQGQLGNEGRRAGRRQARRQGPFLSGQQGLLQGFPDQGRVLDRRGKVL